MKHILSILTLGIVLSFFSTQTQPINRTINHQIITKQIKKQNNIKPDDYNYTFDTSNKFKGEKDRYETKSALDDTEAEIYDTYRDGRREKVNLSNLSSVSTYATVNDNNENNDTFETATVVYKVNNSVGMIENTSMVSATISQKTSGWGPWKKTYIDKDFYCYDVVVTGTLEITLKNIPSNCDYDLRLYKLSNNLKTSYEELSFDSYLLTSKNGGNSDEHILTNVTPGTYYACVYAYNDLTWDNDHYYQLTFEQVEDESSANRYYDINTNRTAGDLCAIWTSGYKPLGITPMTLSNSNAKVEFDNYKKYPFIHNLYDVYKSQDITYAKVYVWDLAVRGAIYAVLNEILKTITEYDAWKDSAQKTFNTAINGTSLVLSIAGATITILGTTLLAAVNTVLGPIGIVVGVASVLVSLASFISCFTLTSPFDIKKSQLREYLINAKAAFEVGVGTSDKEVVTLAYRYHLGESGKHFIDYSPVYRDDDSNLYNKAYIDNVDDGSRFTGTIKGYKNYDDIMEELK